MKQLSGVVPSFSWSQKALKSDGYHGLTMIRRKRPAIRHRKWYFLFVGVGSYHILSGIFSIRYLVDLSGEIAMAILHGPPSPSSTLTIHDGCVHIPSGNGGVMSNLTKIPEHLENAYLKLDDHLDENAPLKEGRWKDFRVQGVAANHLKGYKVNFLWNAIHRHVPQCRTVCEIGLNAGHSSVLWMEVCPDAKAVLFDLPYKEWSQATFDFLRKEYAGRITISEGNSIQTVPDYLREHPSTKCDVIAIDGSKDVGIRYQDFLNMEKYAHEHTLLLLDDASIERIQASLATFNVTQLPSMALNVNDLYASMFRSNYLQIQGACSINSTLYDRENSTVSAFYSGHYRQISNSWTTK